MSDRGGEQMPGEGEDGVFVDPFARDDPEAQAREQRRREREAKRRGRAERAPAPPVAPATPPFPPDPPASPPPPPSKPVTPEPAHEEPVRMESAPEEPARTEPAREEPDWIGEPTPEEPARMSAEDLMPRRESRRSIPQTGITDDHELPPPAVQRHPGAPGTGEWTADGQGGAPPLPPARVGSGGPRRPGDPRRPSDGAPAWLRWLVAAVLIALIVVAAVVAVPKLVDRISGSEDPVPTVAEEKPVRTTTLTIPEGFTRAQIAELAGDAGLRGNYLKETKTAPKAFRAEKKGAPRDADLEGFLFPSTYEIERRASVSDLIDQQLTAFNTNIAQVNLKKAKKANLTEYDVVIIASMIEREVMVAEERRVVAAVIYNRLRESIPLGIDATLRYHLDNFDEPLTESDLATDSPFNTRLEPGLPPSPIANPGLAALEAAANPTNDDYLYYVVKPNTCGEHFFTDDYDEFLRASEEYNSAREAEGKAPTDC